MVVLKTQLTIRNLLFIYNWEVKSIRPADTHVSKLSRIWLTDGNWSFKYKTVAGSGPYIFLDEIDKTIDLAGTSKTQLTFIKETTMATELILCEDGWTQRSGGCPGKLILHTQNWTDLLIQMAFRPPNTGQIPVTLFLQVTSAKIVEWLTWLIPPRYHHTSKDYILCQT